MKKREERIRELSRRSFSEHKATVRVDTTDLTVIEWRNKNGSSNYYVQYIIDKKNGDIYISGDLGSCVSSWYGRMLLEEAVSRTQNIGYWMSKFQATSDDYEYKYGDIMDDLEEIKVDYIENKSDYGLEDMPDEEIEEDFEEILNILTEQWIGGQIFPQDAIDIIEKYNTEWWEDNTWTSLGERISPRVYLWSEGLKMAYEQYKDLKTDTVYDEIEDLIGAIEETCIDHTENEDGEWKTLTVDYNKWTDCFIKLEALKNKEE